jgi:glutamate formiminotransferase
MFWKPVAPNAIFYENPVDDPMYSAHISIGMFDSQNNKNVTYYKPDHPMKAAACQQQVSSFSSTSSTMHSLTNPEHQFCHARAGKADFCTPFAYRPSYKIEPTDFPDLNNSVQRVVLENLLIATWLYTSSETRSNKVADRQRSHGTAIIESIPDGFWKEEVLAWEQEAMASLQIAMTQYAIGHKVRDEMADRYWLKPTTEGEKKMCKAQKMKKTGGFVYVSTRPRCTAKTH